MENQRIADVWMVVLPLKGNNTPAIRIVKKVEAERYKTGNDAVEGIDKVIVLKTSVDFTKIGKN